MSCSGVVAIGVSSLPVLGTRSSKESKLSPPPDALMVRRDFLPLFSRRRTAEQSCGVQRWRNTLATSTPPPPSSVRPSGSSSGGTGRRSLIRAVAKLNTPAVVAAARPNDGDELQRRCGDRRQLSSCSRYAKQQGEQALPPPDALMVRRLGLGGGVRRDFFPLFFRRRTAEQSCGVQRWRNTLAASTPPPPSSVRPSGSSSGGTGWRSLLRAVAKLSTPAVVAAARRDEATAAMVSLRWRWSSAKACSPF
nr:hypothetical protein Iba_chr13bCG8650 [Ipomoea batatas]